MIRNKCVICESILEDIHINYKYPISFSPPDNNINYEKDEYNDQIISTCKECGCIQVKSLISPDILYKTSHNLTFNTETWKEHHDMFASFILEDNITSLLEIGGSSGILYNKLLNNNINYKCVDLCETSTIPADKYIIGNCENYEYNNIENVGMSHVFEHLYNPLNFIECLGRDKVKNIYISIPNLEYLLDNERPFVIHNEHTFYIDYNYINYMFSKYGYTISKFNKFKSHSLFIKFTYTNCNPLQLIKNETISRKYIDIMNNLNFKINIPKNSYIVPGGYLGQLLFTLAKPESIYGFIDNDITKQGRRVYGTPLYTYSFDILKKHKDDNINIYIISSPYNDEIIQQIKSYSLDLNIIIV